MVQTVAFSPDDARLVTASDDGTARVWDAATGTPLGAPLRHDKVVRGAAFSPNGARLVTASDDGTAKVWNAATGTSLGAPLRHDKTVRSAAFSPDGARLVTASDDGTARVWDAATGTPLGAPIRHAKAVNSAAFSPDGTRLVTASDDGTARVWDAATGSPLGAPLQHAKAVNSAAFSPDGSRVVTTSDDGTVRIWDAVTGDPLGIPFHHSKASHRAMFSSDSARVVAASWGGAQVSQIAEAGPLDAWVRQATRCVAPSRAPIGSSLACPLAARPTTATDLVARAEALVASGDRAVHGQILSTPRARYFQARSLLDPAGGSDPRQERVVQLHRRISARLALVAAAEDDLAEARTRLGPGAPETDAQLLAVLGGIAHDELYEDSVAVALFHRALDLTPGDPDLLADLAETHFAAGQIEPFLHAVAQIDQRRASRDLQVAIAALLWAHHRLNHAATAADADRLVQRYGAIPSNASLHWGWRGTWHALRYGRHRHEDVKPILDLLTLLERPVTDDTRDELATLLLSPALLVAGPPH